MQLTHRQFQILEFIRRFFRDAGFSPTCEEIRQHFGFRSPASVTSHLDLLEKKGAILRTSGFNRNIELTTPVSPRSIVDIPLLGMIPAGYPNTETQHSDRCISIDIESLHLPNKHARTFAIRVSGDSMKDAAILDGDVVIMELCEAWHRDIVAALIDGEVTLKRFLIQEGQKFLRAENPKYPDLIPAQELIIQGVFRALIRTDGRCRV